MHSRWKAELGLECDQRVSFFPSGSYSTNFLGIEGVDQEYNATG